MSVFVIVGLVASSRLELADVLCRVFSRTELHAFARDVLGAGYELDAFLPGDSAPLYEHAEAVVKMFQRLGIPPSRIFTRLHELRPNHSSLFERLERDAVACFGVAWTLKLAPTRRARLRERALWYALGALSTVVLYYTFSFGRHTERPSGIRDRRAPESYNLVPMKTEDSRPRPSIVLPSAVKTFTRPDRSGPPRQTIAVSNVPVEIIGGSTRRDRGELRGPERAFGERFGSMESEPSLIRGPVIPFEPSLNLSKGTAPERKSAEPPKRARRSRCVRFCLDADVDLEFLDRI